MRAGSHHSDEPHSGQKWNATSKPLAEGRAKTFAVPSINVTHSRGKKAATLNSEPVRRWQSKQWQSETLEGSPVQRSTS